MLAGLSLLQERYIFIIFPWPFVIFHICQMRKQINAKSSVIRQKANLKIEVIRKQSTPNFPKKANIIFVFRKIWRALLSCYLRFEVHPFAWLPTKKANLHHLYRRLRWQKLIFLKIAKLCNWIVLFRKISPESYACLFTQHS